MDKILSKKFLNDPLSHNVTQLHQDRPRMVTDVKNYVDLVEYNRMAWSFDFGLKQGANFTLAQYFLEFWLPNTH